MSIEDKLFTQTDEEIKAEALACLKPNPYHGSLDGELIGRIYSDYKNLSGDEKRYFHEWEILHQEKPRDYREFGNSLGALSACWLDKVNWERNNIPMSVMEANKNRKYERTGNFKDARDQIDHWGSLKPDVTTKSGNFIAGIITLFLFLLFGFCAYSLLSPSNDSSAIASVIRHSLDFFTEKFFGVLILYVICIGLAILIGSFLLGVVIASVIIAAMQMFGDFIVGIICAVLALILGIIALWMLKDALFKADPTKMELESYRILDLRQKTLKDEVTAYADAMLAACKEARDILNRTDENDAIKKEFTEGMASAFCIKDDYGNGEVSRSITDSDGFNCGDIISVIERYYKKMR